MNQPNVSLNLALTNSDITNMVVQHKIAELTTERDALKAEIKAVYDELSPMGYAIVNSLFARTTEYVQNNSKGLVQDLNKLKGGKWAIRSFTELNFREHEQRIRKQDKIPSLHLLSATGPIHFGCSTYSGNSNTYSLENVLEQKIELVFQVFKDTKSRRKEEKEGDLCEYDDDILIVRSVKLNDAEKKIMTTIFTKLRELDKKITRVTEIDNLINDTSKIERAILSKITENAIRSNPEVLKTFETLFNGIEGIGGQKLIGS